MFLKKKWVVRNLKWGLKLVDDDRWVRSKELGEKNFQNYFLFRVFGYTKKFRYSNFKKSEEWGVGRDDLGMRSKEKKISKQRYDGKLKKKFRNSKKNL